MGGIELGHKRLIMLGTGAAMVTHCFNTCFVMQMENGEFFLTDAGGGNGILQRMEQAHIDYGKLHHMFVTHGHTDHVLGVIWVIRKIATLMNQNTYKGAFYVYGHNVVLNMLRVMTELMLNKKDLKQIGKRIFLQEIRDGETIALPDAAVLTGFDIASTKARQFGYKLQFADGMTVACLGDEPYNERCRIYAEDSDWLLSEAFCLYAERDVFKPYEKHHSTVKEACETARDLGARNLVLYHTEDTHMMSRKALYMEEGRLYYAGNIYVPEDLEAIDLV